MKLYYSADLGFTPIPVSLVYRYLFFGPNETQLHTFPAIVNSIEIDFVERNLFIFTRDFEGILEVKFFPLYSIFSHKLHACLLSPETHAREILISHRLCIIPVYIMMLVFSPSLYNSWPLTSILKEFIVIFYNCSHAS